MGSKQEIIKNEKDTGLFVHLDHGLAAADERSHPVFEDFDLVAAYFAEVYLSYFRHTEHDIGTSTGTDLPFGV
jgi:hypothetical protein